MNKRMESNLHRWTWLPVPVLLLVIVLLRLIKFQFVYDSQSLLLVLNFLFLTLPFGLVSVLMARNYIARPNLGMLAFGCGSLLWCGASIFSPLAMNHGANVFITIYNILVGVSAFCHLAGATLTQMTQRNISRPMLVLTAAYAIAAGIVWLVVHATLQGWMPVFFIPGQGGTPVRLAVLSATVAMLIGAAGFLWFIHRRVLTPFVCWYCLGFLLLGIGLFGVMLQSMNGSLLNWTSRVTQMLGGVYIIFAAFGSLRNSDGRISLEAEMWDYQLLSVLTPQWFAGLPAAWQYALAVAMAMTTTALRWAVMPWLGTITPYSLWFFGSVVTTALVGLKPGLLFMILGIIGVEVFVLQDLPLMVAATMVRITFALSLGSMIAFLIHTARKAFFQARETAERLATFTAATFEGIIEGKEGKILDCNEQLGQLLGYRVEELKGMHIAELVAPEDRDGILSIIQNGNESIIENEMLRKDGTRVTVEAHGWPVGHSGIRHTAIRDITDRRRREEELRRSEARYRLLHESLRDGFVQVNMDGSIVECNEAYCRMLGSSFEELRLLTYTQITPERWHDMEAAIVRDQVLTRGYSEIYEKQYRRKDETIFPVELRTILLLDEDGRPAGMWAIVRDITDRKLYEEELMMLNDELERRVEQRTYELQVVQQQYLHAEKLSAIGKLSASIAHEFNSPLQSVMTVLKGLKKTAGLEGVDLKMLELAIGESERMKNLIGSLRDFNRPSSDRKTFINVQQSIESVLMLIKSDFSKKKINVTCDFSPHLPQILAVPDQFKQVLINLLTNAMDACAVAGGDIMISTYKDSDRVAVTIKDTGIGIPPENMEHIFRPFFSTKEEVKGTGLGLSVSYGIVKKHQGELRVESEPGVGTTFTVLLPINSKEHILPA